jgi:hypothetical protein
MDLLEHRLRLPGEQRSFQLPLCTLAELGALGPDPRDVYDGFEVVKESTPFPTVWGHDADVMLRMINRPNLFLEPLSSKRAKRKVLRKTTDLWPKAANVLLAMRIRLNTKRLTASLIDRKVLSDVWWPFLLRVAPDRLSDSEKAIVLWMNSTLGVLLLVGHREETEGAWVQFKKPVLHAMPMLDVKRLDRLTLARIAQGFDRLSSAVFQLIPEMANDPTRTAIDQVISEALGLPDLTPVRVMLSKEPTLCLTMERLRAADI